MSGSILKKRPGNIRDPRQVIDGKMFLKVRVG